MANEIMIKEKNRVALISVFAAVFLTAFKIIIGYWTNSLGILSEALHSGLDLLAALITFLAVRIADKPADRDHSYGHGKVENLSALVETILLLITCVWIVHEAIDRLLGGKTHIEVNIWSYIVVITSIIVDFSRSRALYRIAKKYKSQALEADALHFSTDIWSSAVVLLGLVGASFGFYSADAIAALAVAVIVIIVSYKLGKKAIDILLDKTPEETFSQAENILKSLKEISCFHDLKVRDAGANTFIEVTIHVKPHISIEKAHEISHFVEEEIKKQIENCIVHVHAEPETHETK